MLIIFFSFSRSLSYVSPFLLIMIFMTFYINKKIRELV